jgi:hypothetical protein
MKICGTSLIPIFVTIILCGAIFVYFNTHLAEVKNSVEKQNRVLTAFITNVQNDIRSGGMIFGANVVGSSANGVVNATGGVGAHGVGAHHLASEEAIRAVKLNEKIVVSDDECDDSDSESDDESDEESDDDSDDDEEVTPEVKIINLHETIELTEMSEEASAPEPAPTQTNDEVEVVTLSDVVTLELISDNLTLELDQLPELNLNTSVDSTKTEVNYEQMKVDDLRKIAMDLNLGGKDEIKKFKKPELLVLLKNKSN